MKILYINSSHINGLGGNTIQLVHELNMWNLENEVTFFSFAKIYNPVNMYNLNNDVKVIFPTYKNSKFYKFSLSIEEYIIETLELDKANNYDLIICRGAKLNFEFYKADPNVYAKKAIAYITDINNVTDDNLKLLMENCRFVKCQSEIYAEKYNFIDRSKFLVQPPIVQREEKIDVEKTIDIMYAGSIAKGWGVNIFLKYVNANPEINAVLVYTRFGLFEEKELEAKKKLMHNTKNLTVYSNLPNEETKKLFRQSKISFCYRDETIDNDDTHEISTKLIECCELGTFPIVRDCKINRLVLGDNEECFCSNDEELESKLKTLLEKESIKNDFSDVSKNYYPEVIYKSILEQMSGEK